MTHRFLLIILCAASVSFAGCAAKHATSPRPRDVAGFKTARAVKLGSDLAKYVEETNVVRALAWVEISDGSEDRKTSAAIALRRPASIRVDAMDELADAWAMAGTNGSVAWLLIPARSKFYSGRATKEDLRRFSNFDWEISELVSLAAGSPPLGEGESVLEAAGSKEMHFATDGGRLHIWLDKKTKRVAKCARYSDGGGRMDYTAAFSDHRRLGNTFFPYTIEAVFPDRGAKLIIRYDEVTLGGKIDGAVFLPPNGNRKKVN